MSAQRWIGLAALVALASAAAALAGLGVDLGQGALLLAAVIGLPLGTPLLERVLAIGERSRAWVRGGLLGLQLVCALTLGSAAPGCMQLALWSAALAQAAAHLRSSGGAALCAALAAGLAFAALRLAPSHASFVALFIALLCALPGLVLLHSDWMQRAARRPLGLASALPATFDGRGRVRFALGAGLLGALPLLALVSIAARTTSSSFFGIERTGTSADPGADGSPEAQLADAPPGSARWSDRMSFGEGVGRLSDDVVAWVTPRGERPDSLLLTVLYLDTFDARGLGNPRLEEVRRFSDAEDGRADGWIRFEAQPAGDVLELEILQIPLRIEAVGGSALVRLEPLLALREAEALYDPGGVLVLPDEGQEAFSYRLQSAHPERRSEPGRGQRARHPEARYHALPEPSPALERIALLAESLCAGARDDRERVARVLEHFAGEFGYSLEGAGFVGVDGAARFLEQRVGYCTSFAASAVLLLRAQGLACRAAGGYLASEWDRELGAFAVRGRNAHAWIEVYYEGLGWRAYDPTPADERAAAMVRRDDTLTPTAGEWTGGLLGAVRDAALGRTGGSLARIGERLAEAPAVLGESVRELPPRGRAVALALLLVLALGLRHLLRPRRRADFEGRARAGLERGPYARLLDLLERAGWSPAASESLRTFAARVEAARALAGFARATEIHLAERFGGLDPSREDHAWLVVLLERARAGGDAAIAGQA